MATATCWICGASADTAEHMIKASDLRSVFGKFTNQSPVFRHSKHQKNEIVRGANSSMVKFLPSLCAYCNNTLTQEHDKAWEKLSSALRNKWAGVAARQKIPLAEIFAGDAKNSMPSVHLYFLKLLGCQAVEHKIPLPTRDFATCINCGVPQKHLDLTFVRIKSGSTRYDVIVDKISALNVGGKTVSAKWFYIVGNIGVVVSYKEFGHRRLNKSRGWHPNDINQTIWMK
jgi:hypothetical protein